MISNTFFPPTGGGGSQPKLTKEYRQPKHLTLRREPAKFDAPENGNEAETAVCGDHGCHDDEDDEHLEVGPVIAALEHGPGQRAEYACDGRDDANEDERGRRHVERRFPKQDRGGCDGGETCDCIKRKKVVR